MPWLSSHTHQIAVLFFLWQVLFNFRWLHAKLSCMSPYTVLADFDDCLAAHPHLDPTPPHLDPAVPLLMDAIRLSSSVLRQSADMLGAEITGRLLPYYKTHARIRQFREFLTDTYALHTRTVSAVTVLCKCI